MSGTEVNVRIVRIPDENIQNVHHGFTTNFSISAINQLKSSFGTVFVGENVYSAVVIETQYVVQFADLALVALHTEKLVLHRLTNHSPYIFLFKCCIKSCVPHFVQCNFTFSFNSRTFPFKRAFRFHVTPAFQLSINSVLYEKYHVFYLGISSNILKTIHIDHILYKNSRYRLHHTNLVPTIVPPSSQCNFFIVLHDNFTEEWTKYGEISLQWHTDEVNPSPYSIEDFPIPTSSSSLPSLIYGNGVAQHSIIPHAEACRTIGFPIYVSGKRYKIEEKNDSFISEGIIEDDIRADHILFRVVPLQRGLCHLPSIEIINNDNSITKLNLGLLNVS